MTPELTSHRFEAAALRDVLEFCRRHPADAFTPELLRDLLTVLPASPAHVLDIWDGEARVLVASVLDTMENVSNAANLEVLGLNPALSVPVETVVSTLLGAVFDVVRRGSCDCVEVVIPDAIAHWRPALQAAGFSEIRCDLMMARDADPDPAATPQAPGEDFAWRDITPDDATTYRDIISDAFDGVEGVCLPDEEAVRRIIAAAPVPARLLSYGAEPIGCVRLGLAPERDVGVVHSLGLLKAHHGHGLGPWLLREAVRVLSLCDVSSLQLWVVENNRAARRLYEAQGWHEEDRVSTLACVVSR